MVLASSTLASISPFITISPLKSKFSVTPNIFLATTFLSNVVSLLTFKLFLTTKSLFISISVFEITLLPFPPIVIFCVINGNIFLSLSVEQIISLSISKFPVKFNLPSISVSFFTTKSLLISMS